MSVEKFDYEKHSPSVRTWLAARGMDLPHRRLLSDLGYVVGGKIVGFLFTTNSGQAYIDNVAADPKSSAEERAELIGVLLDVLEGSAREKGIDMITALASMPAVKDKLEHRGFAEHGEYTLYYKVLGDK